MSILSSTALFNFTDSFTHLEDNLLKGFYAATTYEKLPRKNNGYSIPMVCFCDIPLSMIKEHLDWYGRFGIGIKRSYAREHGVTPVFYLHSDNSHLDALLKEDNHNAIIRNLIPLMKQFFGYQDFQGIRRKKKFYDEHEWRYIPPKSQLIVHLNEKMSSAISRIEKQTLRMPINYNSIEYIIVEKPKFITPLLKIFDKIVKQNKAVNRELLISKILTAEQISRDF